MGVKRADFNFFSDFDRTNKYSSIMEVYSSHNRNDSRLLHPDTTWHVMI